GSSLHTGPEVGTGSGERSAALNQLDDVEAARRLDEIADRPRLETECSRFERRHNLALREEAEVAAVRCAAGILRLRARDGRKVAAAAKLLADGLGFGLRLGLLRRCRVARDADQNVAGMHALALL